MKSLQLILTILCGLLVVVSWFFPPYDLFAYLAVVAGSYFAVKAGWSAIQARALDVNVLMIFAAVAAVGLGHPGEAAVLLFLFSLSNTLESVTLGKTKSAIEGLMKLRPETALLVLESGDESVPVPQLKVGDRVRVLPFDHIPVDGMLCEGRTNINQVAMTGEAEPVAKQPGDKVLAGTQNMEGMIVMEVTSASGETTLEKIVALVEHAQQNKASGEKISQWFGQRYTFFVITAFVFSLVLRAAIGQKIPDALYSSLTLLVALSPCALVISSPAAALSALAWAARHGILVRGGEFIETAGKATILAIDKTGTLTAGRFAVSEICLCTEVAEPVGGGKVCRDEEHCWHQGATLSTEAGAILRAAAAAEQYSTHPIAEAIVQAAREHALDIPEASELIVHPGLGVSCRLGSDQVRIGQLKLFERSDRGLPVGFDRHAGEMASRGMTVAVIEFGGTYAAIGLRDEPRPEASEFLTEIRDLGFKEIVMLTGDTDQTAQAVARELGITKIHAGLLPQEKEQIISDLSDAEGTVMMVGDGINDAPSLARASIGVAMGGLGSDVALNAADVVLMQDRLQRIPDLVKLGRMTNRVIRANLIFAAGVICTLTLGSIIADMFLPSMKTLLLPLAVIGHEGSTVLVILNGLRLLGGPKL